LAPAGGCADGFDGRDVRTADALDRGDTGAALDAVDMHGARAAQRHAAAKLRAGHAEHVTRHPQRRRIAVDIDAVYVPIDFDGEGHGAISNQVDGNVDVAAGCFGVRTGLVRFGS
jgi:hypothetical protein